jgi:hypothetical protein
MKATLLVRLLLILLISLQLGMLVHASAADQKPATALVASDKPKFQFELFPNPSTGPLSLTFNLQKSGTVKITVVDMIGKEVSKQQDHYAIGQHRLEFSLLGQKAGIYFVQLDGPDGKNSKKIVLK